MKLEVKNHLPFSIEPIEGKNAEETQRVGCKVLQGLRLHYWITSGNLLGIYRDKKLIDFDTDIDVGVLFVDEDSYENSITIIKALGEINFALIRSVVWENKPMQLAFMDLTRGVIFDIYFFYKKDQIAFNYNPEGKIEKPMRFINKLGVISFEGDNFPCPNHLEEYLRWRFGNWEIPATKKVAWQEEAKHLQLW